jgi:hypothetical protein
MTQKLQPRQKLGLRANEHVGGIGHPSSDYMVQITKTQSKDTNRCGSLAIKLEQF